VWACSKIGSRTLAEALEQGEKTLSRPLLEQYALSVDRCGQMVSEAVAGETALNEDDHAAYRLRVRLGLEQGPAELHGQGPQGKDRQESSVPSPRRHARVGQRKPVRDPVKK